MPRELSKAEQAYIIENNGKMTPAAMCEDMPGVGPKTVETFIESSVLPEEVPDETREERQEKINKAEGITAGKFMARDPERGIVVMTQGASEISDARRVVNVPSINKSAKAQPSRIHIMDPSKKAR